MPEKLNVYKCEFCNEQGTFKEIKEHEKQCVKEKMKEEREKKIRECSFRPLDRIDKQHCYCCGRLVLKYEEKVTSDYEGRVVRGELKEQYCSYHKVLSAVWCEECAFELAKRMDGITKIILEER